MYKSSRKQRPEYGAIPDGYVEIPETLLEDFSAETLTFYRHCFAMFDIDKNGLISGRELAKLSSKLGYKLGNDSIEDLMRSWDTDEDGEISFEEFVRAMPGNTLSISEEEHKAAEIRRRFKDFDLDGNGFVSFDEAHSLLKKELAFTKEQSMDLFNKYDSNGDKKLNYDEFCRFYGRIAKRIEWIRLMFSEFDKDQNGRISVAECRKMLRKLNMSDGEVEELVSRHDTTGDGELKYEEFVHFLMEQNPPQT